MIWMSICRRSGGSPDLRWRSDRRRTHGSVVVREDYNLMPITTGNIDTGVRYSATNPVAGLVFRAADQLPYLYGSYGRHFETPYAQ